MHWGNRKTHIPAMRKFAQYCTRFHGGCSHTYICMLTTHTPTSIYPSCPPSLPPSFLSQTLTVQGCLAFFTRHGLVEIPSTVSSSSSPLLSSQAVCEQDTSRLPEVAPVEPIAASWDELPIHPALKSVRDISTCESCLHTCTHTGQSLVDCGFVIADSI